MELYSLGSFQQAVQASIVIIYYFMVEHFQHWVNPISQPSQNRIFFECFRSHTLYEVIM